MIYCSTTEHAEYTVHKILPLLLITYQLSIFESEISVAIGGITGYFQ